MPDAKARLDILTRTLATMPHALQAADIEALARVTEGKSSAVLVDLCREAAMQAIRQSMLLIEPRHFEDLHIQS